MSRQRSLGWLLPVAALALSISFPGMLLAGGESMTLRINDTSAEPGGLAAVVLRTYAPRGVGQGQICLAAAANRGASGSPFVSLESVVVFSEQGDANVTQSFDEGAQMGLIEFDSLSATINWSDGPLAVLFFRVADTVTRARSSIL